MCGILGIFNYQGDIRHFRERAINLSKRLRHRGPDWSGIEVIGNHAICHERLAIVDLVKGEQPFVNDSGSIVLAVNGEIYNHVELRKKLKKERVFKTSSDCEVLMYLYEDFGPSFVKLLNGIFAFILYDRDQDHYLIARDPIGVISFYYGYQQNDSASSSTFWCASEMKALVDDCTMIHQVPPGQVYLSSTQQWQTYNPFPWITPLNHALDLEALKSTLIETVRQQLMADAPFGVLLSGGLDSSLIAAIAMHHHRLHHGSNGSILPPLHSFSIGLEGSPDLVAGEQVAQYLGTTHHSLTFTVQQGLDALSDVIYHLETFDVTTIRASTPMFLLARKIKALGIKMVLSGEGSDELFGGYLYFHKAPNALSFHQECVKLVQGLHTSDCLRANKSTMAWGLEARVPFLDSNVVNLVMSLNASHKLCGLERMEKWILREAFQGWLPDSILWRQKEQFSDGVGYRWIDALKQEAEFKVSDTQFQQRFSRFPTKTPETKEAYWYREVFEQLFPQPSALASIHLWVPQAAWGCPSDPSGRAQEVHLNGLEKSMVHGKHEIVEA